MAITMPADASRSLMTALCFLRIASEYVQDVGRQIDAPAYRKLKMDKPVMLMRDAFNHLVGPVSIADRDKLKKELEQYAEIQVIIAQAISMSPGNLEKLQAYADDLLKTQS